MKLLETFKNKFRRVTVQSKTAGSYVAGEWQTNNQEPIEEKMIVMPLTPETLRDTPEGAFTTQDKKFYANDAPRYKEGAIFRVDETNFEITQISDRSHEANFTIYFGKKQI